MKCNALCPVRFLIRCARLAARPRVIEGTTLEHAETLTRERYAVKDYFPSCQISMHRMPLARHFGLPQQLKRQPRLLHEQHIVRNMLDALSRGEDDIDMRESLPRH